MILTDLIKEQVIQCAVMMGAGVFIAVIYQIYLNTSRLFRWHKAVRAMAELVFWILAAMATSQFLYYCAYGRLSFHSALSFGAGLLLWKIFFCDIINNVYANVAKKKRIRNRDGKEETQQPIQGHQSGDRY